MEILETEAAKQREDFTLLRETLLAKFMVIESVVLGTPDQPAAPASASSAPAAAEAPASAPADKKPKKHKKEHRERKRKRSVSLSETAERPLAPVEVLRAAFDSQSAPGTKDEDEAALEATAASTVTAEEARTAYTAAAHPDSAPGGFGSGI